MMFGRKKSVGTPDEPRSSRKSDDDARWKAYVDHAQQLPLLTDDDLEHFARTGEGPVLYENIGAFWMSQLDTQFVIRLRRTLLAKAEAAEGEGMPTERSAP